MVNTIRILSKPGGHIYLYGCFGVADHKGKFVGKISPFTVIYIVYV